ncbi:GNAT family N-acetyltransferase [Nocardiopsis sp. NPDC058789]|uniref:GNAT family N-acetyltransferase n=1 Tax=Nocardiopsis sp. NPDC058789 TaxID=3346634 RepID=UPI00366D2348
MPPTEIRPYRTADEEEWLRCRVLSFLHTAYHDDVVQTKPVRPAASVELVAVRGATLVGILDAELDGDTAVIETVAVHPDHQGRGVGGRLLSTLLERLREQGVRRLDAWTRDDPATLAWYRSGGFTDHDHYLHVYADHDEVARLALAPLDARTHHASRPASVPKVTAVVRALAHADPADEEGLRAEFRRVHLCRRFTRPVDTPG